MMQTSRQRMTVNYAGFAIGGLDRGAIFLSLTDYLTNPRDSIYGACTELCLSGDGIGILIASVNVKFANVLMQYIGIGFLFQPSFVVKYFRTDRQAWYFGKTGISIRHQSKAAICK